MSAMLMYGVVAVVAAGGATALALIGYGLYSTLQEYRRDRVPVLLYHQLISKEKVDRGELVCSERVYVAYDVSFAEQMKYLHDKGYTTITLDELLACRDKGRPLPHKPIIVTFDDGFMSTYVHAFPILKQYGMTAAIFVNPDRECRNFKKYAHIDAPLSPEQIREMSEYGISIESHGMTHRYLTELPRDVARWELQESKKVLEELSQKPVRFLAVPSGAINRSVRQLAQESGYEAIFIGLKGTNNQGSNRYTLRRLVVARDCSLAEFEKLLRPSTAIHLRLTSVLQDMLLSALGPAGFDDLRNSLCRSRLGSLLIGGQTRFVIGGLAVAIILVVLLGSFIVGH
jgi:peptidoglycan/xylan/chitin deacetylase (PgdA/CDA1 family)